jgi:hypothetical protein
MYDEQSDGKDQVQTETYIPAVLRLLCVVVQSVNGKREVTKGGGGGSYMSKRIIDSNHSISPSEIVPKKMPSMQRPNM